MLDALQYGLGRAVGRPGRLLARAGRRRRLDPRGAADGLSRRGGQPARRDRYQRAGGRRQCSAGLANHARAGTCQMAVRAGVRSGGGRGRVAGSTLGKAFDGEKLLVPVRAA